jgi:hypothetical protein
MHLYYFCIFCSPVLYMYMDFSDSLTLILQAFFLFLMKTELYMYGFC